MRLLQSLLGIPALLLMQCLVLVERALRGASWEPLAAFVMCSLTGCVIFFVLLRTGWSDRFSDEASLSRPQMLFAMLCVGWAYVLAGPTRPVLMILMPLILSFGVFALEERAVRELAVLGILVMAGSIGIRCLLEGASDDRVQDAMAWSVLAVAMGSIAVLSRRMARMRERLRAQKAELSEALERIRTLAARDPLTGLFNRTAMMDLLVRELQRQARRANGLTLALVDLDHFKQINDQLGHRAGDQVLAAFGETVRKQLRAGDLACRWGGEEFLLFFPDALPEQAIAVIERLRSPLRRLALQGYEAAVAVTFSAGVAHCAGPDDLEAAIDRADVAMYRAKGQGRDRTIGAPEVCGRIPPVAQAA